MSLNTLKDLSARGKGRSFLPDFSRFCCLALCFFYAFLLLPRPSLSQGADADEKGVSAGEEAFVYDPAGKRDPFRSLILGRKEEEERLKNAELKRFVRRKAAFERAAAAIPFTPLQGFELDSLRLTMILLGDKGKYALVEIPGGKGFTVRKGTYLGRNQGVVREINESGLVVFEKYFDEDEVVKTRRIEINLKKERL